MQKTDKIEEARTAFQTGKELLTVGDLTAAKKSFKSAFQAFRRYPASETSDCAFLLAVCIVEGNPDPEELLYAEDLLLRYGREGQYGNLPKECVLAKVYALMGKHKLARLVAKEMVACSDESDERGPALAGAAYALQLHKEGICFAEEALPLLKKDKHIVERAIVLETLARASTEISSDIRLSYAQELLQLAQQIPYHPFTASVVDSFLLLSCIHIVRAEWEKALAVSKEALLTAENSDRSTPREISVIHRCMAHLYDVLLDPRQEAIELFHAQKLEIHFVPDMALCADALLRSSHQLEKYHEYRLAMSSAILSLRCFLESEDPEFDDIRERIIYLQKLDKLF